jgi:tRNA threonylcarbamoyladenosine biosynthesis protein TsaB
LRILAIETSMGKASVAFTEGGACGRVEAARLAEGMPLAEGLMPLIRDLASAERIDFKTLGRIAVCTGPGGFSSIRAGVAAARGIGLAAGVSVVGATSFHIMATALELAPNLDRPLGLAALAGRDAVFCQIVGRGGEAITEIEMVARTGAAAFFQGRVKALAGPAAAVLVEEEGLESLPFAEVLPNASTLASLAPALDPKRDRPVPFYVRPPDARPQSGSLISRPGGNGG